MIIKFNIMVFVISSLVFVWMKYSILEMKESFATMGGYLVSVIYAVSIYVILNMLVFGEVRWQLIDAILIRILLIAISTKYVFNILLRRFKKTYVFKDIMYGYKQFELLIAEVMIRYNLETLEKDDDYSLKIIYDGTIARMRSCIWEDKNLMQIQEICGYVSGLRRVAPEISEDNVNYKLYIAMDYPIHKELKYWERRMAEFACDKLLTVSDVEALWSE